MTTIFSLKENFERKQDESMLAVVNRIVDDKITMHDQRKLPEKYVMKLLTQISSYT